MFITQNNENSAENASLVIVQDNEAVTTSLKVAEVFEKQHKHVLRDIENLILTMNHPNQPKFGLIEYQDPRGRKQKAY